MFEYRLEHENGTRVLGRGDKPSGWLAYDDLCEWPRRLIRHRYGVWQWVLTPPEHGPKYPVITAVKITRR
jgi:hypothetical protein